MEVQTQSKDMQFRQILQKYLPETVIEWALAIIKQYKIRLEITKSRIGKRGDYRCPHPPTNNYHQITVNHDLNKYEFLITFAHEIAHLKTWVQYRNTVQPHGNEWKNNYTSTLVTLMQIPNTFPSDVMNALIIHLRDIKSSTVYDTNLVRVLNRYSPFPEDKAYVQDLAPGTFFENEGKVFQLQQLQRKRYQCLCLDTNQTYLFSPIAIVKPIK